jgi:hypothetical protein
MVSFSPSTQMMLQEQKILPNSLFHNHPLIWHHIFSDIYTYSNFTENLHRMIEWLLFKPSLQLSVSSRGRFPFSETVSKFSFPGKVPSFKSLTASSICMHSSSFFRTLPPSWVCQSRVYSLELLKKAAVCPAEFLLLQNSYRRAECVCQSFFFRTP